MPDGTKPLPEPMLTSLPLFQCHLDKEGATDLVVDLIINNHSSRIFLETVELGIALLEGGNSSIQKSFFSRLTLDKNSEKFFKVFYDRVRDAQSEIKATVTVNTSDSLSGKQQEGEEVKPEKKEETSPAAGNNNNKKKGQSSLSLFHIPNGSADRSVHGLPGFSER